MDNAASTVWIHWIIKKFDLISKKYEGCYCDRRSIDCLNQDLCDLFNNEIKPVLGDDLGKKALKEALIEYCGFAYGVTVFRELFGEKQS